nr:hypothetical protein BaRGS_028898 [Batillaria attramentaria]
MTDAESALSLGQQVWAGKKIVGCVQVYRVIKCEPKFQAPKLEGAPSDYLCGVCLDATQDIRTAARILGQLEGVCAKAGPGKEECNDVITGLTQEVLQYLLADMVANPMENLTCELCEVIVEEIDRLVTNSSTPAEANRTVYTVCEALPEPLRDTSKNQNQKNKNKNQNQSRENLYRY